MRNEAVFASSLGGFGADHLEEQRAGDSVGICFGGFFYSTLKLEFWAYGWRFGWWAGGRASFILMTMNVNYPKIPP